MGIAFFAGWFTEGCSKNRNAPWNITNAGFVVVFSAKLTMGHLGHVPQGPHMEGLKKTIIMIIIFVIATRTTSRTTVILIATIVTFIIKIMMTTIIIIIIIIIMINYLFVYLFI